MSARTALPRPRSNDPAIQALIDELARYVETKLRGVVTTFSVVKDKAIAATDTRVDHNLGRPPLGWIPIRKNALADIAEITPSTAPSAFVFLRASAPVTATILFVGD